MPDDQLRITDTNSATDSQGSLWSVQGDLIWILLGGVFVASTVLLILLLIGDVPLITMLLWTGAPLLAAVAFALFKQSHPPGYDLDLLDYWLHGPGFAPMPAPPAEPSPLLALCRADPATSNSPPSGSTGSETPWFPASASPPPAPFGPRPGPAPATRHGHLGSESPATR